MIDKKFVIEENGEMRLAKNVVSIPFSGWVYFDNPFGLEDGSKYQSAKRLVELNHADGTYLDAVQYKHWKKQGRNGRVIFYIFEEIGEKV